MTEPTLQWRLDFTESRPLSMNARQHWSTHARHIRHWRGETKLLALAARIPPQPAIWIELHYAPRDARRRDTDNLMASLKPIKDGLVDAGIVPDDTRDYVRWVEPVIDPPSGIGKGHLYLLIQPFTQTEP